jgi:predicted AlkP superfamily phosphohydrolase/phosphomutase
MSRIFVIGWDGATFDLIEPWVAGGRLPNIAEVFKRGAHGALRSTMPPMTFPAWTSFMTGTNPGKHGIFDFTRQRPGSYDLEFVNGAQRKAASFWKLLSDAGRRVISISVPCTFPPEHVNGIMLSGFDAPGLGGSNSKLDARGMYPPSLCAELEKAVGGHPIGSFPIAEINQGRPDVALEKILTAIRRKAATAKYLIQEYPWDCAMILFGESDGVGHHFWKYCDRDSPLYTAEPPGMEESIFAVYQELDHQLGELTRLLPPDVTLLMMSDHGFGGVSNSVLYPNCWLREQDLLQFRGAGSLWTSRALDAIKIRAVAMLPSRVKRAIYRAAQGRIGGMEAKVRYGIIDWSCTKAYFEENPYYPVLWINLKGRQPSGVVEPGKEYESLRSELIERLEDWRHPATGERVVLRAYRREEVYCGPYLEEAPDIIVQWGEREGYTYAFRVSSKSKRFEWTEDIDPAAPQHLAFFTGKSGSHRDDGIFLARGPNIRSGMVLENAQIVDVAPTILHLLNVAVPEDMDGRVLREMFAEEFASTEVAVVAASTPALEVTNGKYSADDEVTITERLRALGYIS